MNRTTYFSTRRLDELFKTFKNARIAVVGDHCLDVYWQIDGNSGIPSLETGKMTQPVYEQRYTLGGAANVVANLCAMGVEHVSAFGVVGSDPFGPYLRSLLEKNKCNHDHLLISEDSTWQTQVYCKPYLGEDEQHRFDMGTFNRLSDDLADKLVRRLDEFADNFDIILINQQVVNGIHTTHFQQNFAKIFIDHPKTVFILDRRQDLPLYTETWLKVNSHEALELAGEGFDPFADVSAERVMAAMEKIYETRKKPFIVTRGAEGCLIRTSGRIEAVPGIKVSGKIDIVGAGDAFLAGLTAAVACGATLPEAARIGNLAASVTVKKIGMTGTASQTEIIEALNLINPA